MQSNIFHTAIKSAIDQKNIPLRVLESETGISFSHIASFLRAEKDITSDKLLKLLKALDISVIIK